MFIVIALEGWIEYREVKKNIANNDTMIVLDNIEKLTNPIQNIEL